MQGNGLVENSSVRRPLSKVMIDPQPIHLTLFSATCSFPTTGILFSDWQAMTHALQPMQVLRLTDMPHSVDLAAVLGGRI